MQERPGVVAEGVDVRGAVGGEGGRGRGGRVGGGGKGRGGGGGGFLGQGGPVGEGGAGAAAVGWWFSMGSWGGECSAYGFPSFPRTTPLGSFFACAPMPLVLATASLLCSCSGCAGRFGSAC